MSANSWGHPGQQYDPLAAFDGDFKPMQAIAPSIDTLADGDYDMEVVGAARDRIGNDEVLRVSLRIPSGLVVEKVYWLNRQQAINALGADLLTLGFDADKWQPPARPFSAELPKALPRLKGLRFRARKHARTAKDGKVYHDLHVNGRVSAPTPMPAPPPPAQPPTAAGGSDDVPF